MVWKEAKDAKGRVYYYDTVTRKTSWTLPKKEVKEKPVERIKEKEEVREVEKGNNNEVLTEAQAKEKFSTMLKDHGVDIQWSFDRVMDELSTTDERYWFGDFDNDEDPNHQWDDPLWKQNLWQDYVWGQQSQRLEDHISSFQSLLKQKYNDGSLKLWHPWPYASKHILNMNTDYSFVILDNKLQRKLYYQYIYSLKQSKEEQEDQSKQQAKMEMKLYLQSIINSTGDHPLPWDKVLSDYISSNNKRFVANKNFQLLTQEDNLIIYIELVNQYETKLKEQLQNLQELNYTQDRYARDQFKSLLRGESEPKLTIKFNSTWNRDIYPQIRNHPIFLSLVGRHGSSPLDLFHDRLQEHITFLKTKSSLVQNIAIERGLDMALLNMKQVNSIISEENDKVSVTDIDELVEFMFSQRHSQELQLFNTVLNQFLRTHTTNTKLPTWEETRKQISQSHKVQFTLLSDKEMHSAYETWIHQINFRGPSNNSSKKRSLEHIDLDY
ncbi:pre-mRNA-processing protein Prp40p [Monosporozyma unispora]|nr:hypothetical protein C6P44_004112 [Kazachstania unispora]